MSPRHRCSHAAQGVNPQDSDQVITTATEDEIESDGLKWPHRDGLNWPHPGTRLIDSPPL